MGNRGGRLHRDDFSLGRARWRSRAWICCSLDFRARRRTVMGPGYTEIFFLDEATALAAGHRPCFECRRAAAREFAEALAHGLALPALPRAAEIDRRLHDERLAPAPAARRATLPPGAIYRLDEEFYLRARTGDLLWSFGGYLPAANHGESVVAITPPSVRAALAAGYAPRLHETARQILSAR